MRIFLRAAGLGILLLLSMRDLAAAQSRTITEKDLLAFKWVADPRISPDGQSVAYVLVTVNEKEDRYDTSVWLVPAGGAAEPRRLTAGPRDTSPRWSPDSRTLAFTRAAAEKDRPQIFLLSMSGGEPRRLTDLPRGAASPVWSPDGKVIAFTSGTSPEDLEEQRTAREHPGSPPPKKSDVRLVTRAVYRRNGSGWIDPAHHDHVWTVAVTESDPPPAPRAVTSGRYDEGELAWSADGHRILFTSDRVDEPYYEPSDSNLYAVPAGGGALETVIDISGPVREAAISPDGSRWAFVGSVNPPSVQSHTRADLFLFRDGRPTALTSGKDFEIGSSVGGDQRAPRGGNPGGLRWTADGKSILTAVTEHGRANLVRIDSASGAMAPLTSGDHDVMAWTSTPDASRIALTIGDDTHIGDLFVLDTAGKGLRQLTRVNEALLSALKLPSPEEIWYSSFDGKRIHGWILKPPDFDASKKYPMILEIHGGPHAAYGNTFTHEFQWMAAKGYVVFYTNPRGSTTYGQDFANVIQYRYPGDDFKDLMIGVDQIVKRGYVDTARLGVTGGSGGGLLTNWIVTQTDRFKAAVSQRSVADWASFWYTADFSLFTPSWFRGNPMRDAEEFWTRSPVRYADKIVTPMLFVEGDDDLRTPPTQGGEAMFRALKAQKKTAVMVRFPGETHELSRSGKPSHRVERLQHIVNWFEKYLKGEKIEAYDLQ
ncbi:MAG: prolyl oligopeptidase family serine peptidase [Thermoanaerobaculia bacterium]